MQKRSIKQNSYFKENNQVRSHTGSREYGGGGVPIRSGAGGGAVLVVVLEEVTMDIVISEGDVDAVSLEGRGEDVLVGSSALVDLIGLVVVSAGVSGLDVVSVSVAAAVVVSGV